MASVDIEAQMQRLAAAVAAHIEELSVTTADAIAAEVAFYRASEMVSRAELLFSVRTNLELVIGAIGGAGEFDTSPAAATGHARAVAGVPLSSVMEAYRVAFRHVWEALIAQARETPQLANESAIAVAARLWAAQDRFTQAMTNAYREWLTQQALTVEAERGALIDALLDGRVREHPNVWEVAQLLRIPAEGPYVVVAAEAPAIGRLPLPQIDSKLRSVDLHSAWRLLPDVQLGIVHIGGDAQFGRLTDVIARNATTRVGISSRYHNLAATHPAVRFARVALAELSPGETGVSVFDDSLLATAAVSSPEVMNQLADTVLGRFADIPEVDRRTLFDTFRAWADADGAVNDAAAVLFVHPNTVRHRLRRLEERAQRSLSKPRELAELCLVLEVERRLR